jgi:virginiamycin B lyase
VVTPSGLPYFCEFGTNKLASIDPKTLQITEYPLPNASSRPRRLALAPDSTIYFTDYARGYLGHFNPETGTIQEWASPGGDGSEPYGIAVTPDGTVWYAETGVKPNTLVRFDPKTKQFSSTPVPSGGGVIRNMAATKDGKVYMACSGVNKVGIAEVEQ